ncbi:MAG TPA: hypothetical protein H9814_07230 [Candidatus Bacteroides merdigallinarum]|uniref:Uncharacterized protein n=1 Tax=Candidatus Bacteroides merdigallinarum TaxID=2838473 RepID=A0A9D2E977_9BACE|nr:hypothetical protein [Candidatus Bacteroides merdigallinarum]
MNEEPTDLEDLSEGEQTKLQNENPELFLKLHEEWRKFNLYFMGIDDAEDE